MLEAHPPKSRLFRCSNEDFYQERIHGADLEGKHVRVVGIDVLDRFGLFASYLLRDMVSCGRPGRAGSGGAGRGGARRAGIGETAQGRQSGAHTLPPPSLTHTPPLHTRTSLPQVYFIVAMLLVFFIAGLYTRSVLIVLFTLFNVLFSFGFAYFLYYVVFRIPHMPFMALLAILLLIAIGADDVFIFTDTFEQMKASQPEADLETWISGTMHHAALSILVTSLTTAAALYANLVSEITDIRGFGIISGTALVANYLLMITWIPAGLVCIEKLTNRCCDWPEPGCIGKIHECLTIVTVQMFHNVLPTSIRKLWLFWLLLFLGLGVGGIIVTFVIPKLDLPSSQDFALFDKNSAIEVWFQDLKYKFRYFQVRSAEDLGRGLHLRAMWGIKGEDNGNYLDPESRSTLEFDPRFDMSDPEAQAWLLHFCHDVKRASFVDNSSVSHLPCTLDLFNAFTTRPCDDLQSQIQIFRPNANLSDLNISTDCCGRSSTPIPKQHFQKCFHAFSAVDFQFLNRYHIGLVLGRALWDKSKNNAVVAFEYGVFGNQGYTSNYSKMDPYYKEILSYMDEKLKTAPKGLEHGWIIPENNLGLYDLQRALAFGTYAAIGVSMAAAFIVMFVTSLNIVITIYAILTIFFTISVCAGILVLLGWELNIVESVTLTMSVGLSIDFCIHYGMGYRLSTLGDRKKRVQESFERVASAIFMAAGTTFIAGACIMPSIILFYVQLGTFLMLIMAFSWLFATFFFQSLCYVAGPRDAFAQLPSPLRMLCPRRHSGDAATASGRQVSPEAPAHASQTLEDNGVANPAYE